MAGRRACRARGVLALTCAALVLAWWSSPAAALEVRRGDRVVVPAGEHLADDLWASGRVVEVVGVVEGDVYALAETVVVRGRVGGDLLAVAREVVVEGEVAGDLRSVAQAVRVAGTVGHNASLLADEAQLARGATLAGSWLSVSRRLVLDGGVARGVAAAAEEAALGGVVDRGARLRVDRLVLRDGARVAGPLVYVAGQEGLIEPGATVEGAVRRLPPPAVRRRATRWLEAWRVAAFAATGLACLALAPASRARPVAALRRDLWRTLLLGAVLLVGLPLAAVALALTLVGLPLAVLGLMALPLVVYLAQVPLVLAVGQALAERLPARLRGPWPVQFLLGVAVTSLLVRLPYVGPALAVALVAAALGAAARALRADGF